MMRAVKRHYSIVTALAAASLMLLLGGYAATPLVDARATCNRIMGTWRYIDGSNTMEREFTAEGRCYCRNADTGEVQWVYDFTSVDDSSVYIEKESEHTLNADDTLNVENRFTAKRTSPKDPKAKHSIVGTWEYKYKDVRYRRVFTEDGRCILTNLNSGTQGWVCDYEAKNPTKVNVLWYMPNVVLKGGRLLMENSKFAERGAQ